VCSRCKDTVSWRAGSTPRPHPSGIRR
jgi:hypothetical protein